MRVDQLAERYDIRLQFTHFPLHPDTPPEGLTLEELFAGRGIDLAAARTRMQKLMNEERLPYGERTMTFNSRLAQELAKWAETQPNGGAIHDALFRAYFVDGLNIGKKEQLLNVVRSLDLPVEDAEAVLDERRMQSAVDTDWQRSRDLGVTGVPTFVAGNHGIVGAQSYDVLEQLIVKAGAKRRPEEK